MPNWTAISLSNRKDIIYKNTFLLLLVVQNWHASPLKLRCPPSLFAQSFKGRLFFRCVFKIRFLVCYDKQCNLILLNVCELQNWFQVKIGISDISFNNRSIYRVDWTALMPFKLQCELKILCFSLAGNVMSMFLPDLQTYKTHQIGSVFDHSGADIALET